MSGRSNQLDRRALFSSAAAATLLAATGVSASGLPRQGGRLRMALSGASRDDNWVRGDGLFMQIARQGLVFDGLTEVAADGTLRPELARDWSVSENARRWVFGLREDVQFHDGTDFQAKDAVSSLVPLLDGEIRPIGSHQIEVTLKQPNPGLPLLLSDPAFVIRPAHAPEAGVGTGLYRMERFAAGQRLLTKRVVRHYKDGSAGWFDEVELTSIPSPVVRAQALAEYLVDAVDIDSEMSLSTLSDIALFPDSRQPRQAVTSVLAQAVQVSQLRPMDNLRAAERWWFR